MTHKYKDLDSFNKDLQFYSKNGFKILSTQSEQDIAIFEDLVKEILKRELFLGEDVPNINEAVLAEKCALYNYKELSISVSYLYKKKESFSKEIKHWDWNIRKLEVNKQERNKARWRTKKINRRK